MFRIIRHRVAAAALALLLVPHLTPAGQPSVERVTTVAPFPRGLEVVDANLYVLSRGRVRGSGGVSAEVEDRAGTLWMVDPNVTEPAAGPVGEAVKGNGRTFAAPTDPPFHLWDRSAFPAEADRSTDRPYCVLRYHEASRNFFLCAFSGIDKPRTPGDLVSFSKNTTDGLLRYDTRTASWHEVERHAASSATYPHHDPSSNAPPHGWLNGPDNCLVVGDWLYAVAKDNSLLVRYDLRPIIADAAAGAPPSEIVMGAEADIEGLGKRRLQGQSALAYRDGWLYVGYRTTSEIIRIPLDEGNSPIQPVRAQLIARFDPFAAETGHSANITDMTFGADGLLYVVSAEPGRIYRFAPDPARVFEARGEAEIAWADMGALTGNSKIKCENVLWHDGWVYVTSGDGYGYQKGADGTVYRVQ